MPVCKKICRMKIRYLENFAGQKSGIQNFLSDFLQKFQILPEFTVLFSALRICLRILLAKYNKENIYNANETNPYFQMEPNQTLNTRAVMRYKMVIILL